MAHLQPPIVAVTLLVTLAILTKLGIQVLGYISLR